jgi:hypothetical protein
MLAGVMEIERRSGDDLVVSFGIFVDTGKGIDHGRDLYIGFWICLNNDIYLSLSTKPDDRFCVGFTIWNWEMNLKMSWQRFIACPFVCSVGLRLHDCVSDMSSLL